MKPIPYRNRKPIRVGILTVAFAVLALCLADGASAQAPDDNWHFTLGIDGWAPTLKGELKYPVGPDVDVSQNNLTHFNLVVPGYFEARKSRFSLFLDVIYISLGKEKSNVIEAGPSVPVNVALNSNTSTEIKGVTGALVAGYAVADGDGGRLDVIVGARYLGVKFTTNWQLTANITDPNGDVVLTKTGSISKRADLWDGVIGVKGRGMLSEHWFIPFYADIGTGSSSLTYQLDGGLAFTWGWGSTGLMYRYLHYDQKDDKFLQDLKFSGPELTLAFHF
jgi:hypothetical protein